MFIDKKSHRNKKYSFTGYNVYIRCERRFVNVCGCVGVWIYE